MRNKDLKAVLYPYIQEMNSLDSIKKNQLIPGKAYLVYSINQTHENGRKYMNEVIITLGYYNSQPAIDEEDIPNYDEMSEYNDVEDLLDLYINMTNAIQLSYYVKGEHAKIDPVTDINNLDSYLEKHDTIFVQIDGTHSTKIYKIDLPPIERIAGLKNYIDELKYVPIDKPKISFVGIKYRSAKEKFETRQKHKGGKTKKKFLNIKKRNKSYKRSRHG
jgi:hypothetical protein